MTKPRFAAKTSFVLLLVTVACVVACGGAARSPGSAPESAKMAMAEAPSPSSADMAGKEEAEKGGGDKGKVTTWKRSTLSSNTTRLMVGDREMLPLRAVQAQVRIDGFRARVVLDYVFQDDRPGTLEGNFQVRLPNEASPYFFAFGELTAQPTQIAADPASFTQEETRKMGAEPLQIMSSRARTWTQPREAVIVPKEKAALAYTTTMRQRVDPALMEWSGAGVFQARVFPLNRDKLYRIVIGYDANLTAAGADLEYQFDLPTGTDQRVVDFNVADIPGPVMELPPGAKATKDAGRVFVRFDRPAAPTLAIRFKGMGNTLLTGKDASGSPYFAATVEPKIPAAAAQGAKEAIFLVDTSLSSNPDRFNVWLKLLQAVLDNNRTGLQQFSVLFFNIESHWWRTTPSPNTPENVKALLDYAQRLSLEGATDLSGALSQAARPPWQPASKPDLFLLSDGAPTWGQADAQVMGKMLRDHAGSLFAYNTGMEGTDTALLDTLARESGGAVFSVVGEAEIPKASTAHRARPVRLAGIDVPGGSDILIAGRPRSVFPGQRLMMAGRGTPGAASTVTLRLEREGKSETVTAKLERAAESDLASRAYGQIAVSQLEELGDTTETQSRAYAITFRVVGRTCSLLMLESERDYQRFNIRPENEREIVSKQPASTAIEAALAALGNLLGDPKQAFLSWIQKLQQVPGMQFRISAELNAAIQKMPPSAFAVETAPLQCKLREQAQLPPAFAASLAKRTFDYDSVTQESLRRLPQASAPDALKALSSLVEQNPGDAILARDVGYSALGWGLADHAYYLFRRVATSRPYEPQNYRAMAQALAASKKADLALLMYEIGLQGQFDARFGEFRRILAMDYLRFLRKVEAGELKTSAPELAQSRLGMLNREIGIQSAEIAIMITWNTDGTDVDLHVTEPSGEECFYSHRNTASGGSLTQDVTQGYGPEMYVLPRAPQGKYLVRAHYYASDRSRASARTKVYATVFENWGMPGERATDRVITLETGKDWHTLMSLERKGRVLQIAQ
jgi:hypothetical protein